MWVCGISSSGINISKTHPLILSFSISRHIAAALTALLNVKNNFVAHPPSQTHVFIYMCSICGEQFINIQIHIDFIVTDEYLRNKFICKGYKIFVKTVKGPNNESDIFFRANEVFNILFSAGFIYRL